MKLRMKPYPLSSARRDAPHPTPNFRPIGLRSCSSMASGSALMTVLITTVAIALIVVFAVLVLMRGSSGKGTLAEPNFNESPLTESAASGHPDPAQEKEQAMARDRLFKPLELKIAQSGFAGITGTIVRIESDGAFSVSRFINADREKPHSEGVLKPDALASLARLIDQYDVLALEGDSEETPDINPGILELRQGQHTATLLLEAGFELDKVPGANEAPAKSERARILAIARHILDSTNTQVR